MSAGSASGTTVGKLGIWSLELRGRDSGAVREAAAELDSQGWGALWIAGATGPGIWSDAERLLSSAPSAAVALGGHEHLEPGCPHRPTGAPAADG